MEIHYINKLDKILFEAKIKRGHMVRMKSNGTVGFATGIERDGKHHKVIFNVASGKEYDVEEPYLARWTPIDQIEIFNTNTIPPPFEAFFKLEKYKKWY